MKQSPHENSPCQSELGRAGGFLPASSRYSSLGCNPVLLATAIHTQWYNFVHVCQ